LTIFYRLLIDALYREYLDLELGGCVSIFGVCVWGAGWMSPDVLSLRPDNALAPKRSVDVDPSKTLAFFNGLRVAGLVCSETSSANPCALFVFATVVCPAGKTAVSVTVSGISVCVLPVFEDIL
jgi:hypothetical protein